MTKCEMISGIPDYDGSGIYLIRNTTNGKVYIGSAKNIKRRLSEHNRSFKNGQCNNRFQEDIDLGHKFTCEILIKCAGMMFYEMRNYEKYYVDLYDSFCNGYNTAVVPTYDLDFHIRFHNEHMIKWLSQIV